MRHKFWITVAAATLSVSIDALAQGTPGGGSAPGGVGASGGSAAGGAASPNVGGSAGAGATRSSPSTATTPGGLGTSGSGTAGSASGATGGSVSGGPGAVNLTAAQNTQIMRAFTSVKPLMGINFAIAIGALVPPTVELYQVPTEVVQVVPAYSGYSYFVVADQIVIVEPKARRIVAVMQRTG